MTKIAIVGHAYRSPLIPTDPDWEIWGINDGYLRDDAMPATECPRYTAWWELHGDTPLTRARRPADHFDRIHAMQIPVYYLHGGPPTPSAIKLDTDALAAVGRDYFACTFAYQIALALQQGCTDLLLSGVLLQSNREIVVERPCVAYWLGLAEGRGVRVKTPVALLSHVFRYALDDDEERKDTYQQCEEAAWSLAHWLPGEAERLSFRDESDQRGLVETSV